MPCDKPSLALPPDLDIDDILEAMRQAGGYLDIAPDDALAVYRLAYAHAAARLNRDVPVKELMTAPVVTIESHHTVRETAEAMARAGVSGLPVMDNEAVVGVVSAKDLLRLLGLADDVSVVALLAGLLSGEARVIRSVGGVTVDQVMTAPAVTVTPDTLLSQAAARMTARNINRLPVLDGARLVGMVSRSDVVRACQGLSQGKRA